MGKKKKRKSKKKNKELKGRNKLGQFKKGHKTSRGRGKLTVFRRAVQKGDDVRLIQKAMKMALNGDVDMIKMLASRILPKAIRIHSPVLEGKTPAEKINDLQTLIALGQVELGDAKLYLEILTAQSRSIETDILIKQLNEIIAAHDKSNL